MKLYEELVWRGLIQDISSPELVEKLNNGGMKFYIGTDPTADSLHIGHYPTFLMAKRLKKAGHIPLLLVGGATALIGDPRGTSERDLLSFEEVNHNYEGLKAQVERIFECPSVNNYDWIKNIDMITFLRDYGKFINVNYMLSKDKVKKQMDNGLSFAEFSYMLIQAIDFKYLHETNGVNMQVAGSDQWGNITTGIELIRKTTGDETFAFTMPLVVDQYGNKIGKSEGNALWLEKSKTSSYQMYQYLINIDDTVIIDYLKRLTFLSKEEIEAIEVMHDEKPELRIAQKALAKEVITDIHSEADYLEAKKISECLFSENVTSLTKDEIISSFNGVPTFNFNLSDSLIDILVNNGVCSSKREAREFLSNNAISINNVKENDENRLFVASDLIDNEVLIIKKGKKNYFLGLLNK